MKLAIATLFLAAVASASSWGRDGGRDRGRDGGRDRGRDGGRYRGRDKGGDRGNNGVKKYYCDENYRCGKGYVAKHDYDHECNGKCDKRECCEEDKYYCDEGFNTITLTTNAMENVTSECCKKEEYYCDDIKCGRGYEKKHGFNCGCDGKCDKYECYKEEKRNNGKDGKWKKGGNDWKWNKGDNDMRNNGKRNRNTGKRNRNNGKRNRNNGKRNRNNGKRNRINGKRNRINDKRDRNGRH
ncbi:hypothetical protein SARC_05824 [Sphaeroforma arctica JP610]|uniref:Uncharacterized protein n=1 Tax=Sphaeroforma arctica JP610 TaxID=667725 RepID=A0A0L0G0Z8_9EUKA|nr:hypothetical protein SARC_05824 [Sphaeroforma arctica JP610]KNC81878.1 hypothetical protein SARC_05824 [Sphaeroforma arctica JP610]|eukprot:XP_014155780.1 hypothetical protein SARC_05824 [Sphaeroforma arctica JP610]